MISIVPILGNKKPNINMCDPPKLHKIKGGYDAEPRNYYSIYLIHLCVLVFCFEPYSSYSDGAIFNQERLLHCT